MVGKSRQVIVRGRTCDLFVRKSWGTGLRGGIFLPFSGSTDHGLGNRVIRLQDIVEIRGWLALITWKGLRHRPIQQIDHRNIEIGRRGPAPQQWVFVAVVERFLLEIFSPEPP